MSVQNGWRGPDIVGTGLSVYLDASSPNSYRPVYGTTWKDISGNGFSGSLVNGPVYSSNGGGVIVYDGTDDYTPVSTYVPANNTAITIDIWTKPDSTTQEKTLISKWGAVSLANYSWLLFLNIFGQGNIFFLVGNSAGTSYSTFSTAHNLSTSAFTNFTVTYSSGTVNMYRNGSLGSTGTTATTTLKSVTTPLSIACDFDPGSGETPFRLYDGSIGAVKIYSQALTATEVLQNYNATKAQYGL